MATKNPCKLLVATAWWIWQVLLIYGLLKYQFPVDCGDFATSNGRATDFVVDSHFVSLVKIPTPGPEEECSTFHTTYYFSLRISM